MVAANDRTQDNLTGLGFCSISFSMGSVFIHTTKKVRLWHKCPINVADSVTQAYFLIFICMQSNQPWWLSGLACQSIARTKAERLMVWIRPYLYHKVIEKLPRNAHASDKNLRMCSNLICGHSLGWKSSGCLKHLYLYVRLCMCLVKS